MPDYPHWLQLEPIGQWPGEQTKHRVFDQFNTTVARTSQKLNYELEKLNAKNPRLRIAVDRSQLTLDGTRLRSGQQPFHPGVVLVFDTKAGEQVYPSDGYVRWQANLRAIALTLEALRALDRWMVTHGQQYRGFLAIEPARATAGLPFTDWQGAFTWLQKTVVDLTGAASADVPRLVRQAQRATHPDNPDTGDAEKFRVVTAAEQYLREAGEL